MTTDGGDRSFGAPRFDIVLRGYDRRQVDEHLSRLQRVLSRMRGDLEAARSQANPPPPLPPGLRPRPTPRRRPDGAGGEQQDVVGTFTDRMQTILQAAEDEAAEIRAKAKADAERLASSHVGARVEEEKARATLMNLVRQRDAVLADLTRVRGQLEALLSGPTARIALPGQDAGTAAAARRDAGAGHPLPGTPAAPQVGVGAEAGRPPGVAPGARGTPGPVPAGVVPGGAPPLDGLRDDTRADDAWAADTPVDDTPAESPADSDSATDPATGPKAQGGPETGSGAGSSEKAGSEDSDSGSDDTGSEDTMSVGAVGRSPSRS